VAFFSKAWVTVKLIKAVYLYQRVSTQAKAYYFDIIPITKLIGRSIPGGILELSKIDATLESLID
jgi:hypothetical protein